MKLVVLGLMLTFAIGFFIVAYFQDESRRGGYAMLSGFVLILLAGLLAALFGVEYQSGLSAIEVGTITTVAYQYTSLSTLENFIISFPLILAGFWGTLVVVGALRDSRYEAPSA